MQAQEEEIPQAPECKIEITIHVEKALAVVYVRDEDRFDFEREHNGQLHKWQAIFEK